MRSLTANCNELKVSCSESDLTDTVRSDWNCQPRIKRSPLCESWVGAIDPHQPVGLLNCRRSTNQVNRRATLIDPNDARTLWRITMLETSAEAAAPEVLASTFANRATQRAYICRKRWVYGSLTGSVSLRCFR